MTVMTRPRPRYATAHCFGYTTKVMGQKVNGTRSWSPLYPRLLTEDPGFGISQNMCDVPPEFRNALPPGIEPTALLQTATQSAFQIRLAESVYKSDQTIWLETAYGFIDRYENPGCLVLLLPESNAKLKHVEDLRRIWRIRDNAEDVMRAYTKGIGDWWLEDMSGTRVLLAQYKPFDVPRGTDETANN